MKNLKKNLKAVFIASLIVLFSACNDDKDDDKSGAGTSKETTAEFDNSNFGLYKGIIVGSSGTVKIEINNGNNVAKATIKIDGNTDNLTCSVPLTSGQKVTNAEFTGNFSSFSFSVDANGSNPVVSNININGHDDVGMAVLKEKSFNIAYCYEGISTGGNNHRGVFNVVCTSSEFSGIIKGDDGFTAGLYGSIDANGNYAGSSTTTFYPLDDHIPIDVMVTYKGRFVGDNLEGTWETSWNVFSESFKNSGTATGRKTL